MWNSGALNNNCSLQWSHPEKYSAYICYLKLGVTMRARLSRNKGLRFDWRRSFVTALAHLHFRKADGFLSFIHT